MDFNRLRSFVVVAETGHLTRAAEKLHISQPALSAQIRALEDELDLTLFERTSTGMTLTAAGKRLLAGADKILAEAQAFQAEAQALKGGISGRARLGTLSDPEFIRLGDFMSVAVERYPLLEIDFQHEITGVALKRVRDGSLEASFYYGNMPYPQVAGVALREITYRIAAPVAWRERVEHGVEATRLIGADDEAVVSSLVTSGVGVALMREEVALQKAQAGEVCLWQDTRISTMLRFVYLRSREHDPLIRALLDVLKETWRLRRDAVATRRKPGRQTAARIPGTKESP